MTAVVPIRELPERERAIAQRVVDAYETAIYDFRDDLERAQERNDWTDEEISRAIAERLPMADAFAEAWEER